MFPFCGIAVLGLAMTASMPFGAGASSRRPAGPAGHAPVAVKVKNDNSALGFILPGTKVDVVGVFPAKKGKAEKEVRVLLQNVLVVAVDIPGPPEGGKAVAEKPEYLVITVALTPENAKVLVIVHGQAELTMTLRKPDSKESK